MLDGDDGPAGSLLLAARPCWITRHGQESFYTSLLINFTI